MRAVNENKELPKYSTERTSLKNIQQVAKEVCMYQGSYELTRETVVREVRGTPKGFDSEGRWLVTRKGENRTVKSLCSKNNRENTAARRLLKWQKRKVQIQNKAIACKHAYAIPFPPLMLTWSFGLSFPFSISGLSVSNG